MTMSAGIFQIVAMMTILGFLWVLRCDLRNLREEVRMGFAGLREGMAKVESLLIRM